MCAAWEGGLFYGRFVEHGDVLGYVIGNDSGEVCMKCGLGWPPINGVGNSPIKVFLPFG